ncbi:hypothetical protein RJD24_14705 [Bacillaceae bacterium IKA-2]|nr:hypothetical protein RJD24_14705 [Bacillaceae bacterium IKA-2]
MQLHLTETIASNNVDNDVAYIESLLENLTTIDTQTVDRQNRTLKMYY